MIGRKRLSLFRDVGPGSEPFIKLPKSEFSVAGPRRALAARTGIDRWQGTDAATHRRGEGPFMSDDPKKTSESVLDKILSAAPDSSAERVDRAVDAFISRRSVRMSWIGAAAERVLQRVERQLQEQLNEILHHPTLPGAGIGLAGAGSDVAAHRFPG